MIRHWALGGAPTRTYRDHEGRKAYQSRIDSGHLAHRMQSHIHPRTGETAAGGEVTPRDRVAAPPEAPTLGPPPRPVT